MIKDCLGGHNMDSRLKHGSAVSRLLCPPVTGFRSAPVPWPRLLRLLLPALWLSLPASAALAQEVGESVTRSGTVHEDIYLAGGNVNVSATAEADVVAAGGNVTVGDDIRGDALLAGGSVTLHGKVHDDVRAAGGTVTVDADVGDDALLAGGNVTLAPTARVGGRAWLAGGNLDIGGRIGKELKATGGHIAIGAEVMGDATLAGEDIDIRPGAVIHGNLRYASPKPARIDKAAKIDGTITHLPAPAFEHRGTHAGARVGMLLSYMVTGAVLLLLFPRFAAAVTGGIARAPWQSLGLGLAVLAATPLVVVLLFASLVGLWLGLILLALYLIALLGGFLGGALCTGEAALRRLRPRAEATRGGRVAALVITLAVVGVLGVVPVLGGLVSFGMLLFGLGGLASQVYRAMAAA
jgi:hypothetical protein